VYCVQVKNAGSVDVTTDLVCIPAGDITESRTAQEQPIQRRYHMDASQCLTISRHRRRKCICKRKERSIQSCVMFILLPLIYAMPYLTTQPTSGATMRIYHYHLHLHTHELHRTDLPPHILLNSTNSRSRAPNEQLIIKPIEPRIPPFRNLAIKGQLAYLTYSTSIDGAGRSISPTSSTANLARIARLTLQTRIKPAICLPNTDGIAWIERLLALVAR
jgi:hypothetical protein